jgi:predicted amidohydrolase YtcJ
MEVSPMKRNFPLTLFLGLLMSGVGLSQVRAPLVDEMGFADTILVNGKIVSMDDRTSIPDTPGHIFEAMAIKGEKIMALGTDGEIRRLSGSRTRIVDLDGKTVIPGLIATHYHSFINAARTYGPAQGLVDPSVKVTVVAEKTAEGTAKKLRDAIANAVQVQKIPKDQWITVDLREGQDNRRGTINTWIYHGVINKRHIDPATSNHPVIVKAGSVQNIFNRVAIEAVKKIFPDWEEHTDLENRIGAGQDGQGAVPEAQGLTFELWWRDKPLENLAEALRLQGLETHKMGITTVATRLLFPTVIAAYHLLNRQDQMPHRLAYYIESQRGNFSSLKTTREVYRFMGAPWTTHAAGNKMLWLNGMSNEVWDSTMNEVCLGPDMPDAPPEIKARERCPGPGSKPWESIKTAILSGWRPAQVHGTSSHGARLYIQMLDEAMREGGYSLEYMRNLRTTLGHNELMGNIPDVMAGVKRYGIILNVNMAYLEDVAGNILDYGEELRSFAMPVKTWINQGVRVTFEAAGMDFWTPIYSLITRRIPRKGIFGAPIPEDGQDLVLLPEEAIDRVSALKMATTWASEYMLAEDTIGTLEPGKYADFAVLEKDFFSIPVEEIRNGISVVMTGLGGQIIYE